jgi:hypothetical protein
VLHQGPQWLGDRLDGAEVGAGADDDLAPQGADAPNGLLEGAHRGRSLDAMGHVVRADHDDDDVRAQHLLEGVGQLPLEVAGLGPDDGAVGQLHPAPGEGGDAVGDDRTDGLVRGVGTETCCRAVSEHDDLEGAARAGAVHAVVIGGGVEGAADDPAGQRGLGLDQPPACRAEGGACRGDPTAAVGRGGGDLAGSACSSMRRHPLSGPRC